MKFPCYTFLAQNILTKVNFIMQSITHIKNSVKDFSKNNFKFSSYFDSLDLLDNIPDDVQLKLNDIDFIYHLEQANSHLQFLNSYFEENINPSLKKAICKSKKSRKNPTIPYADFKVDEMPIFDKNIPDQLSFDDIRKATADNGKPLKPVSRRKADKFTFEGTCPFCGAPKHYIYSNNARGQFKCKACHNTFSSKKTFSGESAIYCPHCRSRLSMHHDRKGYIVYNCQNDKCSYYLHNKKLVEEGNTDGLFTSSGQLRLRYHYREFKFSLETLRSNDQIADSPVKLSKIHAHPDVLGLILTYYVNYGLSSRKTALIMKQVHGYRISHQTVLNYAAAVSSMVKPLADHYPYQLSNVLCGDETYIKIRGKTHYVFFWSDPDTKIITSYTIYPVRDTKCACQSIFESLSHYKEIPEDMTLITDGNPIYNAAQLFFDMNDIHFDLRQVIGVRNLDEESAKYRPFKQMEERLNRTYKQNYYGTNGYDRLECANSYMVLFVTFFNFLRDHSSLGFRTPVDDELFEDHMLMQHRWLKLIGLSLQYHQA